MARNAGDDEERVQDAAFQRAVEDLPRYFGSEPSFPGVICWPLPELAIRAEGGEQDPSALFRPNRRLGNARDQATLNVDTLSASECDQPGVRLLAADTPSALRGAEFLETVRTAPGTPLRAAGSKQFNVFFADAPRERGDAKHDLRIADRRDDERLSGGLEALERAGKGAGSDVWRYAWQTRNPEYCLAVLLPHPHLYAMLLWADLGLAALDAGRLRLAGPFPVSLSAGRVLFTPLPSGRRVLTLAIAIKLRSLPARIRISLRERAQKARRRLRRLCKAIAMGAEALMKTSADRRAFAKKLDEEIGDWGLFLQHVLWNVFKLALLAMSIYKVVMGDWPFHVG